jgi:branched-chain amino acid transport system ATP-binding protein
LDKSETLLSVRDVHTYYGDSYVLQGVSLDVPSGRIVAILGRNGMGKTTLIRSVFGLTPPRQGTVDYRGQSLVGLPPYRIAQLGMALVPQGRRIFKNLSVLENLQLPTSGLARSSTRDVDTSGNGWTLDKVLDEFPQLRDRLGNGGNELSGGEQQMLAIGRALLANPDLVLMDEPSEGLSPRFVLHVGEIMKRMRSRGHAILLVEQNLALALSVADEVHIIASGRIVFSGTPDELRSQPDVLDEHLGVSGTKSLDDVGAHG